MITKRCLSRFAIVLSFLILFLTPGLLNAQAPAFTIFFDDMLAFTFANWSYDLDAPGFVHGDSNPYTWNMVNPIYHTYAYRNFGVGGTTTINCIQENIPIAAVPGDIQIADYVDFTLAGLQKINTVNPNGVWGVWGQSGEERTYVSDYYMLTCGANVLYLHNLQIDVTLPYATQAQMRANLAALGYPGANGWTGDMGTGLAVTGKGRADIDWVNSSLAFLNAVDNGNHQLEFNITTFDFLIQGGVGYYDMTVEVYPAAVANNFAMPQVNLGIGFPQNLQAPQAQIDIDVIAAIGGGDDFTMNDFIVNEVEEMPDGLLPLGILEFAGKYWELGTTLSTFVADITFDMTGEIFGNPANWRILKRNTPAADWTIWNDFTLLDANHIRANNVNSLSDWTVGNTEQTLPVTLSAFTGSCVQSGNVLLQWTTQSETDLSGYRVYRNENIDLSSALCLTANLIPACNTSQETNYSYLDEETLSEGVWYYWLESLENNGAGQFYGPVSVMVNPSGGDNPPPDITLGYRLSNYPNPFNPQTMLSFYLPSAGNYTFAIYNCRGELVRSLGQAYYHIGNHQFTWNANDANGKPVSSGVYYIRMTGKAIDKTHKMLLMK